MARDIDRMQADYEALVAERRAQDLALDAAIQTGCGPATRDFLSVRIERTDGRLDQVLRHILRLDPRRGLVGHRTV